MSSVWRKPDDRVHVVYLQPEALEKIRVANEIKALVDSNNEAFKRSPGYAQAIQFLEFVRVNIGLTEAEHEAVLVAKANRDWASVGLNPSLKPPILDWSPVGRGLPLPDREFRVAWRYVPGTGVVISFPEAQQMTKERLRNELGTRRFNAVRGGQPTAQIDIQLAGVDSLVNSCTTVAQLKALRG